MPNVLPPMAKTVIRIGIIQRSLPRRRRTSSAIPAWMAPVFIVMPMNPPITRMNSATSIAPNRSPLLKTSMLPVAGSSMPYRPLIGASSESTRIRCGFESTSWYVPGIGDPVGVEVVLPGRDDPGGDGRDDDQREQDRVRRREREPRLLLGGRCRLGRLRVVRHHSASSVSGDHEGDRRVLGIGNPIVERRIAPRPGDEQHERDHHRGDQDPARRRRARRSPALCGVHQIGSRCSGQVMQWPPPRPLPSSKPSISITSTPAWRILPIVYVLRS